jgi:hypothetical protein
MIRAFTGILLFLVAAIFIFRGTASCTHDDANLDGFPEICFERDILPVFQNGCAVAGCHDDQGAQQTTCPDSILALDGFLTVRQTVQSGPLLDAVKRTGPSPMPPSITLDDCTENLFIHWAEDGYIEKKGGTK